MSRLKIVFVVLFLSLSGTKCPNNDNAPKIPIGTGDGVGGANMVLADGKREYWPPSKLKNSWVTTQEGAEKLISWCYGIPEKDAIELLEKKRIDLEDQSRQVMEYDQTEY